ncbi:MAG: hypothetical protein RR393_07925 [Bacteroidales bacterium]
MENNTENAVIDMEQYTDDELISLLSELTEDKTPGEVVPDNIVYPDFDPFEGGVGDVEISGTGHVGSLHETKSTQQHNGENDTSEVLMSIATLPIDIIVDTVDVTLTELIIRSCKIEEYEGKDEDLIITSEKDKEALKKVAEKYLETQNLKVTPLTGLLITVAIVYVKKLLYCLKLKKAVEQNNVLQAEIKSLKGEKAALEKDNENKKVELRKIKDERENETK